jgi:hypothetical protein
MDRNSIGVAVTELAISARYWQKVTITNANNFNHL